MFYLKELRNYNRKLFLCLPKNRRKHSHYFKLLFFTINLHFVTSNQICSYRKRNLLLTNRISLVFLPPECKEDSNRPKYTTRFFTLSEKERPPQTFKRSSIKDSFSSVYVIGKICFDECFLLLLEDITFHKSLSFL